MEPDLNVILYHITLSDNRTIKVYVNIKCNSQSIPLPSKYVITDVFEMDEVFIGENEPQAQASI